MGLFLSSKALAIGVNPFGLKGIEEFYLIVENPAPEAMKFCRITDEDIERTVKYILSNSKIKLTTKISGTEKIYIRASILPLPMEDYCVGHLKFVTYGDWQKQKNSSGNTFFNTPVSYEPRGVMAGDSPGQFKNYFLGIVEDYTKEFVVEWNKQNK